MRVSKITAALGLLGCAVMNSQSALAEDSFWYIGGNIGQSQARIADQKIVDQLRASMLTTTAINNDDSDTAYKLFGGYQFNKNFALEAGYFNLGQFGYTATTLPAGTQSGNIKLQGLNLDAVGILPVNDQFSVFARLGLQYAQAKDNFSSTGFVPVPANPNPSKNATNYKAGLGLQYDFNRSLGMRVEAERYRIDDAINNKGDVNMYSVGLVYRFGEEKAPPPPPAKVAAAPPAPLPVIVPVVKTQKYCSVLDIQFDIKGNEIQREDKEKLAVLGTYMNKYPDTTAVIEGHADNVGTSEYNMKLSQQRAASVVDYLVNELHISPSRLTAVGYGETRPIADNSTMAGQQANRRIDAVIACATDIAGLKVKPARFTVAMDIDFDPYKVEVEPEYRDGLRQVAVFMNANPSVTATVEGNADRFVGLGSNKVRVGPNEAMKISMLRAQSVVRYLVSLGIAPSRLSSEAFGSTQRVSYGTTKDGQQENRRVNIIINYPKR
jgi:OOP family OmpA-OmpF porin